MNLKRASLLSPLATAACFVRVALPSAQLRVRPVDLEDGAVALGLVLRHLNTTAVFMQATAHPDDENNALHVYLNRGQGVRTILATATRGDGGQNEIGPELYDPLAVLRTEELEAMHRFDASEQYFTRAVDFGYSFSIEETLEKWGRDEIIGDFVRLIRTTRPDVILGMNPTGTAGGLHHQASGLLSREAFKAAGDPVALSRTASRGLDALAAAQVLLPGRRAWRRARAGSGAAAAGAAPARRAESRVVRRFRFRSAARAHLRRGRQRRARHAQEPGDGAAARAAGGSYAAALSADGYVCGAPAGR